MRASRVGCWRSATNASTTAPDPTPATEAWQLAWGPEHGASTLLPGDGGIHRVANRGDAVAVSVHHYGPKAGEVDGRDYDPSRDHVCDRLEG